MIRTLHEGLLADGITVPLAKLCAWFGVPRRAGYYRPTKAAPRVDPRFADSDHKSASCYHRSSIRHH